MANTVAIGEVWESTDTGNQWLVCGFCAGEPHHSVQVKVQKLPRPNCCLPAWEDGRYVFAVGSFQTMKRINCAWTSVSAIAIAKRLKYEGSPREGDLAFHFWEMLSGNRGIIPASDASWIYKSGGYVPFAGYPLARTKDCGMPDATQWAANSSTGQ